MVRGLNVFRDHFVGFEDRYVPIGGAALEVAMDAAGLQFRVTKDLDIILHVEALNAQFAIAFWAFVANGGYEFREGSTAKPTLYRFSKPTDESFPYMLGLFSPVPPRCRASITHEDGAVAAPLSGSHRSFVHHYRGR